MKKALFYFLFLSLFIAPSSYAAEAKTFHGSGEVVTTDPLYSRITIDSGAIKGYSAGGKNEFIVSSASLLKNLSARDLVEFDITENKGGSEITKITKTGVAEEKDERSPISKAAGDLLSGTGQAVKTVTTPITPVGAAFGEVIGSTTEATGNLVSEAKTDAGKES